MTTSLERLYKLALHPQTEGGYMLQHNQYTTSERLFIPYLVEGTEYYFVDYRDADRCRWIRTPSQTFEEVGEIINYISKNEQKVENLRITPESWLSQLKKGDFCEEKAEYRLDEITNRVYLFGDREESFAETFFGVKTLSRIPSKETKEDWIARITQLKEKGDKRLNYTSLIF